MTTITREQLHERARRKVKELELPLRRVHLRLFVMV